MSTIRDFEHAGWQAHAGGYDGFAGATRLFAPALLDAAQVGRGTRLLDICCGTGVASAQAVARGAQATGVDFSSAMLARARRACPEAEFHEADAVRLPFADASFDAAVASFGMHHVEKPTRALAEARRVLRPRGRLAFTLWAERDVNTAWRLLYAAVAARGRMDVPMPAGSDVQATAENLSRMAIAAGFEAAGVASTLIERPWRLPADADLVEIFAAGTVRLAALIKGQTADALAAIRTDVAAAIAGYRRDGAVELPTRAYLITATAPGGREPLR